VRGGNREGLASMKAVVETATPKIIG